MLLQPEEQLMAIIIHVHIRRGRRDLIMLWVLRNHRHLREGMGRIVEGNLMFNYRITSRGGTLFIRESWTGEVIGRIGSSLSTTNPANIPEIVTSCEQFLLGSIDSVVHDEDTVHVECRIVEPSREEIPR